MNLEQAKEQIQQHGWQWLRIRKDGTTLKGYGRHKKPIIWAEIWQLCTRHGEGTYQFDLKELIGSKPTTINVINEAPKPGESPKTPQMQSAYTPEIIESLKELERIKVQYEQIQERCKTLEAVNKKQHEEIQELEIQLSQESFADDDQEPTTWETIAMSLTPMVMEAAPGLISALADRLRGNQTQQKNNFNGYNNNQRPFSNENKEETTYSNHD